MMRSKSLIAVFLCAGTMLCLPFPAHADRGGGRSYSSGEVGNSEDDDAISATAGAVVFEVHGDDSGETSGQLDPIGDWNPPPCWYAPQYTPKQFKKEKEKIWAAGSTGHQWDLRQRERFVEGKPYKDFNLKKQGEGYWWDSVINPKAPLGSDTCDDPAFWVDKGDRPPADVTRAISPEILAKLAYEKIRVPDTDIELSPAKVQKVNLATWAWLDESDFKPVSVTASLPILDIEATTTATPVALKIEPGTKDATLYPASGECPINDDGSIGTPYTKGHSDETPPCGLTYLRASGSHPYQLKATITWQIHWTGTGVNAEQPLPDGTFGTTQDVTVEEIQSIVR